MTSPAAVPTVRPVFDAVVRDIPRERVTTGWLTRWLASEACAIELEYFAAYPAQSLLSIASRALIYHCVRSQKPDVVVEVGTFQAGTSELIARALHENGGGQLLTTDPFGAQRCPAIIGGWPGELRARVEFFPLNSMDFYLALERRRLSIDMAFIDGNHTYECALFDLQMAAKNLARGGTVIMDNVEQAGPYFAAATFLTSNPSWRVIGRDHTRPAALAHPLDSTFNRASLDDASLLILAAPAARVVTSTPFSTSEQPIQPAALSGIRLHAEGTANHLATGELFWEVIYRVFPPDAFPIEIKRRGEVSHPHGGSLDCLFEQPIAETAAGPCTLEVILCHRGDAQVPYSFDSIDVIGLDGSATPVFGRREARS